MKIIITTVAVACLAATNVFAQASAVRQGVKQVENAARKAKTGSAATKGTKTLNPTGAAQAQGVAGAVGAAATKPAANDNIANILTPNLNASAEALGGFCVRPVNSTQQSIESAIAAVKRGVGGSFCYSEFDPKTAETAQKIQIAGVTVLTNAKINHINEANDNVKAQVVLAMADTLSKAISIDRSESLDRLEQTCSNNCDVASKTVCSSIDSARKLL